jgi:hypothetical protein
MPDQVRAKLHKAIGLAFQAEAEAFDPEAESQRAGGKRALVDAALTHLTRALELDGSAGVKKAVERLTADLKSFPPPDTALRHPRRGRNGRGSIRSLARALTPTPFGKALRMSFVTVPQIPSRRPARWCRAMAGGPTSTATPCATRCAWARSSPMPASSPRWKAAS